MTGTDEMAAGRLSDEVLETAGAATRFQQSSTLLTVSRVGTRRRCRNREVVRARLSRLMTVVSEGYRPRSSR